MHVMVIIFYVISSAKKQNQRHNSLYPKILHMVIFVTGKFLAMCFFTNKTPPLVIMTF